MMVGIINKELIDYLVEYLNETTSAIVFNDSNKDGNYIELFPGEGHGSWGSRQADVRISLYYNQAGIITSINGVNVEVSDIMLLTKALSDHIQRTFRFKRKKRRLSKKGTL